MGMNINWFHIGRFHYPLLLIGYSRYKVKHSFSYMDIPSFPNKTQIKITDGGPPTPQPSPAAPAPPVVYPVPPMQQPEPPTQPDVPPVHPGPVPQLNWSHFKPEFPGQPDENAEGQAIVWTLMCFQRVSKSKEFVQL